MSIKATLNQHYDQVSPLGEGAMGSVWRARDKMLERDVAIKVMRPELAAQSDFSERFLVEARALARISHPNIVAVYKVVQAEGTIWIELEFVDGAPLDQIIERDGVMQWQTATRLIIQALQGLEVAHGAGIIHRDIKPSNALVSKSGTLKLMDFGIARVQQVSKLTKTGYTLGTVAYMAPEQIKTPDKIDGRTDLYSVGIMFYELLSGQVPFNGATEFEILDQHVRAAPPALDQLREQVPAALKRCVFRALEKDPAKRFENAAEFRRALEQCLEAKPTNARAGGGAPIGQWAKWGSVAIAAVAIPFTATLFLGDMASGPARVGESKPPLVSPAPEPQQAKSATPPTPVVAREAEVLPTPLPIEKPKDRDLGLTDTTLVKPEVPAPPPVAAAPARVSDPCAEYKATLGRFEQAGNLSAAIKTTGVALDAGCDNSYFLRKRGELVARVRK